MARRVFVHIGAPKTGSTYVQNMLWANREALRESGLLLPGPRAAHDQAMTDLREVSWRDPQSTWTWDRLAAECARWDGDAIISNEALGGATPEQAARAVASLQPAQVHIVVAGRDLWRTFPSMWQQSVRSRQSWRFETFLSMVEDGRFETFWEMHTPNRMLRKWGDLVPAGSRHLVTVPPPGAPRDLLWQRFTGLLDIPDGVCTLAEPSANMSLGAAEVEVLRRVNQGLGDRYPHRTPYQKVVQRHLVDAVLKRGPNELRFGVGADRAGWVHDLAEQQIKELLDYPCDVVGDLEDLRVASPDRPRATTSPDELDDAQVLQAAVDTIIGLLGHVDGLAGRADAADADVLSRLRRRAGTIKRGLRRH